MKSPWTISLKRLLTMAHFMDRTETNDYSLCPFAKQHWWLINHFHPVQLCLLKFLKKLKIACWQKWHFSLSNNDNIPTIYDLQVVPRGKFISQKCINGGRIIYCSYNIETYGDKSRSLQFFAQFFLWTLTVTSKLCLMTLLTLISRHQEVPKWIHSLQIFIFITESWFALANLLGAVVVDSYPARYIHLKLGLIANCGERY